MSVQVGSVVERPERLDALRAYDILDTEPEDAFDDLVAVAALGCGASAALISFVARDRQWFKARVGFDRPQTGLGSSVCQHALGGPALLVIPDLADDPRTAANPLVTGPPHLRFYAGAPLRARDGEALGALCVLDPEPRPAGLSEPQAECLVRLGREVERRLEQRRRLLEIQAELAEERERQRAARDEQRLLTEELAHRLKNTLAMVQAIARQTLRGLPDASVLDAFEARLQALGGAHGALLRRDRSAAHLRDVAAEALEAVGAGDRVRVAGPDVELGPHRALSAALILHELATNALKHGALSTAAGSVALDWTVEGDEFELRWSERGGPAVRPPERRGFGSKLLGMGLVGVGNAELVYDPAGLSARMTARVSELRGH